MFTNFELDLSIKIPICCYNWLAKFKQQNSLTLLSNLNIKI